MKTKTLVVSLALAFSASAFAAGDCKANAPCELAQDSAVSKKIALVPQCTEAAPCAVDYSPEAIEAIRRGASQAIGNDGHITHTMAEMKAAPWIKLDGIGQFRHGQVWGWCLASEDCKAHLRAALQEKEGPWAEVAPVMLPLLDDLKIIQAQQLQWREGEAAK